MPELESLIQTARMDRLLVFIGPRMSKPYDLPTLEELAVQLDPNGFPHNDVPKVFSNFLNSTLYEDPNHELKKIYSSTPDEVHELTELIFRIRNQAIITTNIDRILEGKPTADFVPTQVFETDADLVHFHTTPKVRLIKLHGSYNSDSRVLTREEYDNARINRKKLNAKIEEMLEYCSALFLGYSYKDPEFRELMKFIGSLGQSKIKPMIGFFDESEIQAGDLQNSLPDEILKNNRHKWLPLENGTSSFTEAAVSLLENLTKRISPPRLPQLTRKTIIFTNGHTATLKSELCHYLANCLNIRLFATHRYGQCTNEDGLLAKEKRNSRYFKMLKAAKRAVEEDDSIILDGTFSDPEWRKEVYEMAEESGAKIIAIKTECNCIDYIRSRLHRRSLDHSRSEHEVTDIENYRNTRKDISTSKIEEDELLKELNGDLIVFKNPEKRSVSKFWDTENPDCKTIIDLIKISPFMSTHI